MASPYFLLLSIKWNKCVNVEKAVDLSVICGGTVDWGSKSEKKSEQVW